MIEFQLPPVNFAQANYMTAQLDTIPDDVAVLGVLLEDASMWVPWQPISIVWFAAEVDDSDAVLWCDSDDPDWHEIETTDPLLTLLDSDDTDAPAWF